MSLVSVGEVRDRFSELIAEVERTYERVVVTPHGRPVAVAITLQVIGDRRMPRCLSLTAVRTSVLVRQVRKIAYPRITTKTPSDEGAGPLHCMA